MPTLQPTTKLLIRLNLMTVCLKPSSPKHVLDSTKLPPPSRQPVLQSPHHVRYLTTPGHLLHNLLHVIEMF